MFFVGGDVTMFVLLITLRHFGLYATVQVIVVLKHGRFVALVTPHSFSSGQGVAALIYSVLLIT